MKSNEFSEIILNEQDVFDVLYSGKITDLTELHIDSKKAVEQFNYARSKNTDPFPALKEFIPFSGSVEEFDRANQANWFIPEDQVHHNLVEMLYGMCETEEQTARVSEELQLFIQHGMLDLLFYLKYLVDTLRANNVLWGVGRGSSVASYVLFLIGVHKVDSIKYKLDIHEFLK